MKTLLAAFLCLFTTLSFGQTPALDSAFKKDLPEMDSVKIQGFKDIRHDCLISLRFLHAHELKLAIKEDTILPKTHSWIYPFFHQFVTKPVVEKEDMLMYGSQFISGLADGLNQALVYHHALAGHPFWDYNTSWKRKYRNYDKGDTRPAFLGAKTWAVGVTDGNHLTRGISRIGYTASIVIAMRERGPWWEVAKEAIFSMFINRVGFTLAYNHKY